MKLITLSLIALLVTFTYAEKSKTNIHGKNQTEKPQIFYAKVLEVIPVMGYKYLKVDENGTQHWVAIASAPVKAGDRVGYDKKTVMKNFESKTLGKKFDEIIFANSVYLPQKNTAPGSLKSMLGLGMKNPHTGMKKEIPSHAPKEEKPVKPFVEKPFYTVEEVHMWRKNLKDKTIKIKGKIYKISRNIMNRDWIHLGDGTGDEKELTDDLVFTAVNAPVKAGSEVVASGKVTVDKDFGYGYFYPVIIENTTFEAAK